MARMLISNQNRNYPCNIGKSTCICEQGLKVDFSSIEYISASLVRYLHVQPGL